MRFGLSGGLFAAVGDVAPSAVAFALKRQIEPIGELAERLRGFSQKRVLFPQLLDGSPELLELVPL